MLFIVAKGLQAVGIADVALEIGYGCAPCQRPRRPQAEHETRCDAEADRAGEDAPIEVEFRKVHGDRQHRTERLE